MLLLLLSGCTKFRYTNELREELLAFDQQTAAEWLEENYPGAELKSAEIFDGFLNLTNVIMGEFDLDGKTISFYLNPETGECLTDERFDDFKRLLSKRVSDDLGYKAEDIHATTAAMTISGDYLRNVNARGKETEIKRKAFESQPLFALKKDITDQELQAFVEQVYKENLISIDIELDSYDGVEEKFKDLSYLKAHPDFVLTVTAEDDPDIRYYLLCREGKELIFEKLVGSVQDSEYVIVSKEK